MGGDVGLAPQRRMLWDRRDEPASRDQRGMDLLHHIFILGNVLQNVESTDQIESLTRRDMASVHLDELGATIEPLNCVRQPGRMEFRARETGPGTCGGHGLEHHPGAAPDFKVTPRRRKEPGGEPGQEPAAWFEPKMSGFVSREFIEDGSIKPRLRVCQIRRI